jgi:hypothetical protein
MTTGSTGNTMTDREIEIVNEIENALVNLAASNRKADKQHAERLERRRQAGAFPRLAHLICVAADMLGSRGFRLVSISDSTVSRYYAKWDLPREPCIRVSDHTVEDSETLSFDVIVREDMTDDEVRKRTEEAIKDLEDFEESLK